MTRYATSRAQSVSHEIKRFCQRSPGGLLQLLVAAARSSTFQRIIQCPTYPVPAKSSGLSLSVERFRQAFIDPDIHAPTFLAQLYASVRPLEYRKRIGQFFTPQAVSEWAFSVAQPTSNDDICDAGAGTAIFGDTMLRNSIRVRSYIAVENDPILALCAAHVLESLNAPDSFKVWYANFLLLDNAAFKSNGLRTPTFVISNPPFVRFHNLKGRARIRGALKSSLGLTLSSLSGSGAYFVSRSADLAGSSNNSAVTDNQPRRLLVFLPEEAAGAAHAQRLRSDLRLLHGWTCQQHKIPHPQTGVDRHPSNALALLFVFTKRPVRAELPARQQASAARVRDLLSIRRGISTGCNEFFVLTDEKVRQKKIPSEFLREVLPTRIRLAGAKFSKSDWDQLRRSGYPCWLLVLPYANVEDFEAPVQEYLREGLRQGFHSTPTAKSLRRWFSIPIPSAPPDVFITYFFRGRPRFILNEARVLHLTNILGGRFVSHISTSKRKVLIKSLNKEAESWIQSKMAIREYKGGLRKIEPRELSLLPIDPTILKLVSRAASARNGLLFE